MPSSLCSAFLCVPYTQLFPSLSLSECLHCAPGERYLSTPLFKSLFDEASAETFQK